MLAEGFLRVLPYREEKRVTSAHKTKKVQPRSNFTDPFNCDSKSADLQINLDVAGSNQEELDPTQSLDLKVGPHGSAGLSIPGRSPVPTFGAVCLESCSLLEEYPDLQVADPGCISHNTMRAIINQEGLVSEVRYQPDWSIQQEPQGEPVSSNPDQGYLVMEAGTNVSLDLPGSGLEPMSNSLLNGLLDKQLDEVYMQHLTDNLARCNSNLGSSLLHVLVPPPKPSRQLQGPYSLEASMEEAFVGDSNQKIDYLTTQNIVPCSSNFSSPLLRISETDSHL